MANQYRIRFSNDATTTLAAPLTATSPSLQTVSGGGALFPGLAGENAMACTLVKAGNPNIKEVVLVTAHATGSDSFTGLQRNLSGSGALTWNAGDTFAMLQPAEAMNFFAQFLDVQEGQSNYAQDVGSANNYVVQIQPLQNSSIVGMPIRWRAAHTSTGPSNFNDGINNTQLLTLNGGPLQTGDVTAGGIYETIWDGTQFRLMNIQRLNFTALLGQVSNGQVPQSAVLQWESGIVIGFNQLSGQLFQSQVPNNLNLPGSPTAPAPALLDSSTRLATTSFVNPASLLGTNGYFKRSDGHIVQAGQCNPNGGTITVTLPTTFPNAFQAVVASSTGRPTQCNPVIISNSQFTISNTGGSSYWMAMGY
jgi:hypothetical protein